MNEDQTQERKSFTLDFDLPFSPRKVWRALTDPALMAKWIMPNDLQGDATLGAKFKFNSGYSTQWWDGIVDCEVQELELYKRIRYTWAGGPLDTVVTWTLTETPAGTRLHLEQSGFKPGDNQAFGGARQGWKGKVETLGKVLAEGS